LTARYLTEFHPDHAAELVRVAAPLLARGGAADMAALPLRKALFARDEPVRTLAATGILLLLGVGPRGDGSDESSGFCGGGGGGGGGGGLSPDECVSLLRRCLTHQSGVRSAVYGGVTSLFVDGDRHELQPRLFNFIAAHFHRYCRCIHARQTGARWGRSDRVSFLHVFF